MRALDAFVTWCENHQRAAALLGLSLLILSTLIPGQVGA